MSEGKKLTPPKETLKAMKEEEARNSYLLQGLTPPPADPSKVDWVREVENEIYSNQFYDRLVYLGYKGVDWSCWAELHQKEGLSPIDGADKFWRIYKGTLLHSLDTFSFAINELGDIILEALNKPVRWLLSRG